MSEKGDFESQEDEEAFLENEEESCDFDLGDECVEPRLKHMNCCFECWLYMEASETMTEKCSEIACNEKPVIEIQAWDGITLEQHLFLCRKHWLIKCEEEPDKAMRLLHTLQGWRKHL